MMDSSATSSAGSHRRHLIPPQVVARAVLDPDAATHWQDHRHGHGNDVRLHTIWFALASLVALVVVLTAAALATSSM